MRKSVRCRCGIFLCVAILGTSAGCRRSDPEDPSQALVPAHKLGDIVRLGWGVDTDALLFLTSDGAIASCDLRTGQTNQVAAGPPPSYTNFGWLSSGGQFAAYLTAEPSDRRLIALDLGTRKSDTLYNTPDRPWLLGWSSLSPNGGLVALSEFNLPGEPECGRLCLVSGIGEVDHRQLWGGGDYFAANMHWSMDSTSLAWNGGEPGDSLTTYFIATNVPEPSKTQIRKLGPGTVSEWGAWSPVRKEFVYFHFVPGRGSRDNRAVVELRVFDVDGWNSRTLTSWTEPSPPDCAVQEAAWSPDGRRIAYTHAGAKPRQAELWVVGADGNGRRRLASRPYDPKEYGADCWDDLTWSLNGASLVFVRDGNSISKLDVPPD